MVSLQRYRTVGKNSCFVTMVGLFRRISFLIICLITVFGLSFQKFAWAGCFLCTSNEELYSDAATGDITGMKNDLASGANINLIHQQDTPLQRAAIMGHTEVVKFLLDHGAEVDFKNNFYDFQRGKTALMFAAESGSNTATVQLLLERGADINLRSKDGYTAADYALKNNHREIASLIENFPEEQAKRQREKARKEMIETIQNSFNQDQSRALDAIRKDPPYPPLSEDYRREMVVGIANIKDAKTQDDYLQAMHHFENASQIAPWAPEPYEALGHISQALGDYASAAGYLKLYLRIIPNAPNAREVQDRIYILQNKAER